MQRKGRTGHAQFRLIVQDSRFNPSSGRVVAYVGSYNPHTKDATLDGEKISKYLDSGAQPSDRVAKLLTKEGIKLPAWFTLSAPKKKEVRNPDKRRSTRPAGAPTPEPKPETTEKTVEEPTAGPVAEESAPAEPAGESTSAEPQSPAEAEAIEEVSAKAETEEPTPPDEAPAEAPKPEEPAEEAPKT